MMKNRFVNMYISYLILEKKNAIFSQTTHLKIVLVMGLENDQPRHLRWYT